MRVNSKNIEMNLIRNSTMYKGCLHADGMCNGITSKAHSIQNNRYLKRIADNGEVLCIDFGKIGEGESNIKRVGRNKASIFTGFCNYHDRSIFCPIEEREYLLDDAEQNFLFSYRAFALAYYERFSSYEFQKKHYSLIAGLRDDENIRRFKRKIDEYGNHLMIIEKYRSMLNYCLDNKKFKRIYTRVLVWDVEYGMAATSMFFIYKDVCGNIINDPQNAFETMAPFFFTLIPQNGKTYVLMGCLSKHKRIYEFIDTQIVNADIEKQKVYVSNIIAMYIENFFISPCWWERLDVTTRDQFEKINERSGGQKPPIGFFDKLNIFKEGI